MRPFLDRVLLRHTVPPEVMSAPAPLRGASPFRAHTPGSLRSPGAIVFRPSRGGGAEPCAAPGPQGPFLLRAAVRHWGLAFERHRAPEGRRRHASGIIAHGLQVKACVLLMAAVLAVFVTATTVAGEPLQGVSATQSRLLFDGKTLKGWKPANFGGEGAVTVRDGQIFLEMGDPLTGITWTGGEIPHINYEISLEAMKVNGSDFFCGLTFPVADSFCSLILGGWGGSLVGLSSLDGMDASDNETSTSMDFASDRWYRIRLLVVPGKITAWLDDKMIIDANTKGRRVSIRPEVDLSTPLGVASYRTETALRNISIRAVK